MKLGSPVPQERLDYLAKCSKQSKDVKAAPEPVARMTDGKMEQAAKEFWMQSR